VITEKVFYSTVTLYLFRLAPTWSASQLERKLMLHFENLVAVWLRYGPHITKMVQLLWLVN